MITDLHVIMKRKTTFDTIDIPYATSLSMSGTSYSVVYYTSADHTGAAQVSTFASADYLVYVVPKE